MRTPLGAWGKGLAFGAQPDAGTSPGISQPARASASFATRIADHRARRAGPQEPRDRVASRQHRAGSQEFAAQNLRQDWSLRSPGACPVCAAPRYRGAGRGGRASGYNLELASPNSGLSRHGVSANRQLTRLLSERSVSRQLPPRLPLGLQTMAKELTSRLRGT